MPFCHSYIRQRFPNFDVGKDHETAERKQASLGNELYPWVNVEHENYTYPCNRSDKLIPDGRYQLVCTGYMDGKKYEYLFSKEQGVPIVIDEKIFNAFESVHKNTEYYGGKNGKGGFLKNRLENGEPIPVFFEMDNGRKVVSMGITAKYRYPYQYSVSDMVQRAQSQLKGIDLPEAIFGYIGKNQASLRGRVLVGNAFADNIITPLHQIDGVLGQPGKQGPCMGNGWYAARTYYDALSHGGRVNNRSCYGRSTYYYILRFTYGELDMYSCCYEAKNYK